MATIEAVKLNLITKIASLNDDAILSRLEIVLMQSTKKARDEKKTLKKSQKKTEVEISKKNQNFILKGLPEKEKFEEWVADWEESRKDRFVGLRTEI